MDDEHRIRRAGDDPATAEARRAGRTLLVLDAVSGGTLLVLDAVSGGDAARQYESLGWVRVRDIPGYALYPQGGRCGTTRCYRNL
ncbi:MAG: hypothetical protein ABSH53_21205 [Holophaga sp.]|jgi:hypothetical protein